MPKTIYGTGDEYRPSTDVPRDTEDIDAIDVERPIQDLLDNAAFFYAQNQKLLARMSSLERQLAGFSLITTVTSMVLEPGRTYTYQNGLRLNRFGGFSDAVTIAGVNLPAGVTVSVAPNPVVGDTADLTVAVSGAAVAGQYDLLLRGEGGGKAVEMRIPVTVAQQSLPAAFALSGPSIAAIDRTNNSPAATVALNLERTGGFNSNVAFDVAQAPAGLTIAFSNPAVSGNLSSERNATTATITAQSSVPAGRYTIILRATGGGIVRTWSVILDISGAVSAGPDFSVRLVYDAGDSYKVNGATLYIDRANGYSGPVYLSVEQLAQSGGSWLDLLGSTWWTSNWPAILIDGKRGVVRVDGNVARITADSLSTGWENGGVAPAPTGILFLGSQFGQTTLRASSVETPAPGAPGTRYAEISVRRGNRYWKGMFSDVEGVM